MSATSQTQTLPRPVRSVGQWMRHNLFRTWGDTVVTILFVGLAIAVLQPIVRWMLAPETNWSVIPANLNLFLRGRYPGEFAGRIWVVIYLLGLLAGMSFGTWGQGIPRALGVFVGLPLVLILIPFFTMAQRGGLLLASAVIVLGFVLARYGPRTYMSQITLNLLILAIPICYILLRGFGETGSFQLVHTRLWGGLTLSVLLAISGIVVSYPFGILLALGRRSTLPVLRILCIIYIEAIRGVPLISLLYMSITMLQLFLPADFPSVESIVRVFVAITFFSAAYVAENVRGGLASLPKGQDEAARALGLNQVQRMVFIILPQALKAIIPVTVSQFISLFKDTTLVSLVGMFDLLGIGKTVISNPKFLGTHREVYFFIGLLYWVLNYGLSYGARKLEDRLRTER